MFQIGVTAQSMATTTNPHAPILIIGNSGFTQANGVAGGTGTSSDPYVIGQWQISAPSGNDITIFNTTNYFVIQGVAISSALRGIYLHNVTNGSVRSSAISNNGFGVLVERSSGISISDNIMSDTTQAMGEEVRIDNCTKVSVVNNQIYSATFGNQGKLGVVVNSSPGPIISNNHIWYSGNAVSLDNSAGALVTGNNVSYNLGTALSLTSSPNANITGNLFAHNDVGIAFGSSNNVLITSNVVYQNLGYGIRVFSDNATISKNVLALGGGSGIQCCLARFTNIRDNNFTRDGLLLVTGTDLPYVSMTITPDNLVNGKPLRFYSGCSNLDINGIPIGELILMKCNNIRITNLEIFNTGTGIQLFNVNNTLITSNSVNSNMYAGINLFGFVNITVAGNNLSNNGVPNRSAGLIADPFGILTPPFVASTALIAYRNNFFYDSVIDSNSKDQLDRGYPSRGNFWSQYTGSDICSGSQQNICPNPDGIGDTPFSMYSLYQASGVSSAVIDNYPLMHPYLPTPDTSPPIWLPNTQLYVTSIGQTSATLNWAGAADDVAVVSYQVYRGSTLIANISADMDTGTGYQYGAGNLIPGTSYTFKIVAVDEAGNRSVSDLTSSISTQPQQTSPPPVFSLSWWQQYWYFIALPAGAGVAALAFLLIRRRKSILAPPSSTTPDLSNPGR